MKLFVTILFLNFTIANVCSQNLTWARSTGGTGEDLGLSVTTDAAGNVYHTGSFKGTVDFDPGTGVTNLTAAGKKDIFICKLDPLGNFQWARSFGDTADDYSNFICNDPTGNVYITGAYSRTVDFDPGAGVTTLTAVAKTDAFVLKLSTAGNFVWAKTMGGAEDDYGASLALDASGNVYTTGRFIGSVDFDPGAGVFNITATWGAAMFVSKLDAAGNFGWASAAMAANAGGGTMMASSIAVDAAQNVYTTGRFTGWFDFDPGPATYTINNNFGYDSYACKFNAAGNFVWAKELTGNFLFAYDLALDPQANVYITGFFGGSADFDPGPGTYSLISTGQNSDCFVLKLDANSNFIWVKSMNGTNYSTGISLAFDTFGDLYVAGGYNGTYDFDPGPGVYNINSAGAGDIFIAKLSPTGNFISASGVGGAGEELAREITIDALGNILLTGQYSQTCDFDPGSGTATLTSNGDYDVFVMKLASCMTAVTSQPANQTLLTGSTAQFTVSTSATGSGFQWQQDAGNGFVNLSNAGQYSGVTTATLNISNLMLAQNNYSFRCIASASNCISVSGVAVLKVFFADGIHESQNDNSFIVYPNPATDHITLQAGNQFNGRGYIVSDQCGRQLMSGSLKKTKLQLI